jgi:TolA-binding protein
MPSFDVEFEVFCGTCGAGLCGQSDGRNSRNRHQPQVTVEVCKDCVEKATQPIEDELSEMQSRIDELEREVEDLKQANWQRLSDAEKDHAIRMG